MQEKIFDLIMEQEEVGWKTILYDLVKTEQMNPWDVNVSLITQKYIELIKKMKEHDLKVSGKVLLAAAVLLKIKSNHLIDHDIFNLDKLMAQGEEFIDEDMLDEFEGMLHKHREKAKFQLIPRQPQPRNRKVSIHDLVEALQRAMESKKRVLDRKRPVKYQMPRKHMDIMEVISDIYHKIVYYSKKDKKTKLTFSQLLPPKASKQEKVFTFLPLLHLENQRRVETEQKQPFSEIYVKLLTQKGNKNKAKGS